MRTNERGRGYVRLISAFVLGAAAWLRGDPAPVYASAGPSYHLPFATPVNFSHLEILRVRVSIDGGPPTNFQVDTGSTGVVVSADEVPNLDPHAPAGMIRYSSSGVELHGVWTAATLAFPDSKDAQGRVATALVPVLAVRESRVTGDAVNAASHRASLHPRAHMFGVGFGRGAAGEPYKNPFVNLREMQEGAMRRGYAITRNGIDLGLAGPQVPPGYVFQKLVERSVSAQSRQVAPALKDWSTALGTITVGSLGSPPAAVLIDTGLTNMMIANPNGPYGSDVAAGALVTVGLLNGQLPYHFAVGDFANPLTPRRVTWIKPTHGATVNTGLRALAAFDYLYDADGGYLGLRPVGH